MIKKYLLFAEKENITVLSVSAKGDQELQLEFLKSLGEKTFPLDEKFWDWWKRTVSYTSEDIVDFCVVKDEMYEVLNDAFFKGISRPERSGWCLAVLQVVFEQMLPYSEVVLKNESGEERTLCFMKKDANIKGGIFYTDLKELGSEDFDEDEEDEKSEKIPEPVSPGKKTKIQRTAFARYFMNLLEEENK